MRKSNMKIRAYLVKDGFTDLYFFPHSRFLKDYHVGDCEFDAIGWKGDSKVCCLFQLKTNKPCPEKQKVLYKILMEKYACIPYWITTFDKRKLTKTHPNEIEVWHP